MDGAPHEFILGMVNAEMTVAEIDQAVVAAPPIGVDDSARVDPAADPWSVGFEQSGTISV